MKMHKNLLEWTVFGCSLVLIGLVVGLLLHEHFTTGEGPAALAVTLGDPVAADGRYAVAVDVRNGGDTTAEDVHVRVALTGGGEEETSDVTLPYVPYRSQRRAWVTFSRAPASGRLAARVLGYREP
jgi:uncharacterized protein (TIGR02588 family)